MLCDWNPFSWPDTESLVATLSIAKSGLSHISWPSRMIVLII